MGASKSKPTIVLDNQLFSAGKSITGSVKICIPESQSNFRLVLKLIQLEFVTYLAGGEGEWHNNNYEFCVSEQVLNKNSAIKAGYYDYPFELKTPITLPGSMQTSDNYHKALISYKLVCTGQSDKSVQVKRSAKVLIKQHFESSKSRCGSHRSDLKILSTFGRGNSEITVDLAKGFYDAGEIVNLQVTVDNRGSEIPLKYVNVKLIRNVKFQYKKDSWEEREHKVFTYKYPVIVPNCKGLANFKTFSFAFPLNLKEKFSKGCGTAIGNIVETIYFFEVCGVFGKLLNDLKACVPVIVHPSQVKADTTLDIN